jgi:uncharacterized protein (DUF1499 family)
MATDALTDFDRLERPGSPNTWLVAPAGHPAAQPDAIAPLVGVPAARLAAAWQETVADQQRVQVMAVSDDGLQVEVEQSSALFGFVDDVSFRALPRGEDQSTFIAYSRSRVGYWDIGANRKRLTEWVATLLRRVGQPGVD